METQRAKKLGISPKSVFFDKTILFRARKKNTRDQRTRGNGGALKLPMDKPRTNGNEIGDTLILEDNSTTHRYQGECRANMRRIPCKKGNDTKRIDENDKMNDISKACEQHKNHIILTLLPARRICETPPLVRRGKPKNWITS